MGARTEGVGAMPKRATRQRSVVSSPGRDWLGPASFCMGLLSWAIPVLGAILALCAIACGGASIATRGARRVEWMAAAGVGVGVLQVVVTLLLLLEQASGP